MGGGRTFGTFYASLNKDMYEVVAITDSDPSKWEQKIYGIPIVCPEEWDRLECDYVVIASVNYYDEIYCEVKGRNIEEDKIVSAVDFFEKIQYHDEVETLCKTNKLFDYFYHGNHRITSKWMHYFDIYDMFFKKYIGKKILVCEIGVNRGGSLQLWKKYFGDSVHVLGIDIDPECQKYREEGINIEIGSQEDPEFWRYIIENYPPFDILIDDGGHTMNQQILTFKNAFNHIRDNGIYLCEDLHTSYWAEYGGGYLKNTTFVEYSKHWIDQINAYHSREAVLQIDDFTRNVKAVHYYDSVVVIEKQIRSTPPLSLECGSDGI